MKGPAIDHYLSPGIAGEITIPQGEVPAAIRGYLEAVRAYLREIQESGASGREVNEAHSDLVDRMIRRLFQLSEEHYFDAGSEGSSPLCVMAVGGYARREMSIHSDVDLLFLYDQKLTPHVAAVAERMQYCLWDAQVTVGGATRTIGETIRLARDDMSVFTSVLAPRFLAGSGVLFHQFNEVLRRELLAKPERFISAQIKALHDRHTNFGDTLYLLQPNVKESAGGLRDYHASYWVMQASQSSVRGKNDFLHLGLLTEEEADEFFAALDFQWRVRNELHLIAGRKLDQLSFDLQERIAEEFGYGDDQDENPDLPVERFMRDYYIHARAVFNYSSLVAEQCLARVRPIPRRRKVKFVEDGLRVANGQLEIPHRRQLLADPLLMLRVWALAQEHDVALTRKAQRLIREHLYLIDDAFRRNPEAAQTFLRIIRAERRVTRTLIAMNEVGLLERFLPEWGQIVCRWQHVMYHTYTVDVHSIFLVEELRHLLKGDYEKQLPDLSQFIRAFDDLTAVYLGCLFHDIGKGLGGDHSPKGAVRTRTCLERMGLEPELVDRVVFLVAEHLQMSHLAQRRDLSDPKLILEFARLVGDRTKLRDLYLVTVADIRASSKEAWTDWKGRLLQDLFEKTSEFLETGADDPRRAMELIDRRIETRRQAATAELEKSGVSTDIIEQFFDAMPRRYLTAHTPSQIARHVRVMLDFTSETVMTTAVREMRGGFSEFILWARDSHGLYSKVSGVLTAHRINILGAHVYTSRTGLALEVYRVVTPPGGDAERRIAWDELERSLEDMLRGRTTVDELLRRRGRPLGGAPMRAHAPETVSITNDESDFYTIVDVAANDRVGLLHDLTSVISEHEFEIYISKAAIVLDQVADTFYLKDDKGRKILDADRIERLRVDLLAAARGEQDVGS
jgi:[protein-PII] uridylyltransferase